MDREKTKNYPSDFIEKSRKLEALVADVLGERKEDINKEDEFRDRVAANEDVEYTNA